MSRCKFPSIGLGLLGIGLPDLSLDLGLPRFPIRRTPPLKLGFSVKLPGGGLKLGLLEISLPELSGFKTPSLSLPRIPAYSIPFSRKVPNLGKLPPVSLPISLPNLSGLNLPNLSLSVCAMDRNPK